MEEWLIHRLLFPFFPLLDGVPILWALVWIPVYLLPLWVALFRKHRNRLPIGLLNLLLGWFMPVWVAAIVWASLAKEPQTER